MIGAHVSHIGHAGFCGNRCKLLKCPGSAIFSIKAPKYFPQGVWVFSIMDARVATDTKSQSNFYVVGFVRGSSTPSTHFDCNLVLKVITANFSICYLLKMLHQQALFAISSVALKLKMFAHPAEFGLFHEDFSKGKPYHLFHQEKILGL